MTVGHVSPPELPSPPPSPPSPPQGQPPARPVTTKRLKKQDAVGEDVPWESGVVSKVGVAPELMCGDEVVRFSYRVVYKVQGFRGLMQVGDKVEFQREYKREKTGKDRYLGKAWKVRHCQERAEEISKAASALLSTYVPEQGVPPPQALVMDPSRPGEPPGGSQVYDDDDQGPPQLLPELLSDDDDEAEAAEVREPAARADSPPRTAAVPEAPPPCPWVPPPPAAQQLHSFQRGQKAAHSRRVLPPTVRPPAQGHLGSPDPPTAAGFALAALQRTAAVHVMQGAAKAAAAQAAARAIQQQQQQQLQLEQSQYMFYPPMGCLPFAHSAQPATSLGGSLGGFGLTGIPQQGQMLPSGYGSLPCGYSYWGRGGE